MKARYFAGLATLLVVFLFLLKSFLGLFAELEADLVSNAEVETENVNSSVESTKMSEFAYVVGFVFVFLCLLWHLIAFVVSKCLDGEALNSSKDMDTRSYEMEEPVLSESLCGNYRNNLYCKGYSKLEYSDDEESLVGSPIPAILRTQSSVKSLRSRYRLWLCRPITIIWSKCSATSAPRGLQNIGNTCYFNSVMQILANTYILQTCIHENKYSGEFNGHFERFCEWVRNRRFGSSSSWNLWNLLCSTIEQFKELREMHTLFSSRARRFSDYGQHDSHECLRHILDELRKDERDFRKKSLPMLYDERKSLTVVDKVFGGHFITAYICKECGAPYHLFEPFLDISLPICLGSNIDDKMGNECTVRRNLNFDDYATAIAKLMTRLTDPASHEHQFPKSEYSITDCLWYFTRTEHIQNEYLCRYCYSEHGTNGDTGEGLTSATKQTLIFSPPAVITIHLKRFELKPGKSEKRSDRIRYDELLDIAPYCSVYCLRNDPPQQNLWYSLYGIIVHSGSLEFGHYVAYIKIRHEEPDVKKFLQVECFDRDKTTDQLVEMMKKIRRVQHRRANPSRDAKANQGIWYCMNDNWVSEVTIGEILNQEAYLLLYERI